VGLASIKSIEDGKLTMDTKVNDLLPFQVINPYFEESPILIRHLATHTSSILDTKQHSKTYILDDSFIDNEHIRLDSLGFLRSYSPTELRDFLFNLLCQEGEW